MPRTARAQARAWRAAGLPPPVVSVTLSVRRFLQPDAVARVLQVMQQTGLPPELLELDLTESLIARAAKNLIETVDVLKAAGMKPSVDDFGAGYSSLASRKRFRVETLKGNQSFVRSRLGDAGDRTIVPAVIALAHNPGMTAPAVGVESGEHLHFLREMGCDAVQRYSILRARRWR